MNSAFAITLVLATLHQFFRESLAGHVLLTHRSLFLPFVVDFLAPSRVLTSRDCCWDRAQPGSGVYQWHAPRGIMWLFTTFIYSQPLSSIDFHSHAGILLISNNYRTPCFPAPSSDCGLPLHNLTRSSILPSSPCTIKSIK